MTITKPLISSINLPWSNLDVDYVRTTTTIKPSTKLTQAQRKHLDSLDDATIEDVIDDVAKNHADEFIALMHRLRTETITKLLNTTPRHAATILLDGEEITLPTIIVPNEYDEEEAMISTKTIIEVLTRWQSSNSNMRDYDWPNNQRITDGVHFFLTWAESNDVVIHQISPRWFENTESLYLFEDLFSLDGVIDPNGPA